MCLADKYAKAGALESRQERIGRDEMARSGRGDTVCSVNKDNCCGINTAGGITEVAIVDGTPSCATNGTQRFDSSQ